MCRRYRKAGLAKQELSDHLEPGSRRAQAPGGTEQTGRRSYPRGGARLPVPPVSRRPCGPPPPRGPTSGPGCTPPPLTPALGTLSPLPAPTTAVRLHFALQDETVLSLRRLSYSVQPPSLRPGRVLTSVRPPAAQPTEAGRWLPLWTWLPICLGFV